MAVKKQTTYVLGFAFNEDKSKVILIRKNRPEWMSGKLNGIGGHIEEGECKLDAMQREFLEETGIHTPRTDWNLKIKMRSSIELIYVFSTILPENEFNSVKSITDEQVCIVHFTEENCLPPDVLPNLLWLIPLCLDETIVPVTIVTFNN